MVSTLRRVVTPCLARWRPRVRVEKPEAAEDLPPNVLAALDQAIVHRRRCDDQGGQHVRVIVQFPNSVGWYHSPEATREAVAQRFPTLSAEQVELATAELRSIVNSHLRVLKQQERRPNWATNW